MTNRGKVTNNVTSISLTLPSDWVYSPKNNILHSIEPNQTEHLSFQIKFPNNVVTGSYKLGVLVNTYQANYYTFPEITVKGFDTIPITANELSLSLFIIVVSGLVTFFIISIGAHLKLERSYITLGFSSIGLGLMNFLIVRIIAVIDPLGLHLDPLLSFLTIITGAMTGLLGIVLYWFARWVYREYKEDQSKKKRKENILNRGYEITSKTFEIWSDFIAGRVDYITQNLGKHYSITVKVYLKSSKNNSSFIEGILWLSERKHPIDIILFPAIIPIVLLYKNSLSIISQTNLKKWLS